MTGSGSFAILRRQTKSAAGTTRIPVGKESPVRNVRPDESRNDSHQVLFPLAVAAIFVATLIAGALL
jgi:hypothetical protein